MAFFLLLLALLCNFVAAQESVYGRWQNSKLPPIPDDKLPLAPLLGNGYMGIILGSRCCDPGHPPPAGNIGPGLTDAIDFHVTLLPSLSQP